MLAGVSTRKYAQVGEPVDGGSNRRRARRARARCRSCPPDRTRPALSELMGRRLDVVRLAVMILDGLELADPCHVVALGVSTDGFHVRRHLRGTGRSSPKAALSEPGAGPTGTASAHSGRYEGQMIQGSAELE